MRSICKTLALLILLTAIDFALAQSPSKSFGERQVEQMLDDRPDMKDAIGPDDFIYKWVVSAFEGEGPRERVYWNANKQHRLQQFQAWHIPSYGVYPPQIYVSTASDGIDKWFSVVFEHFNMDTKVEEKKLLAKSINQGISPEKFADIEVEMERKAEKRTIAFLESRLPETHPLRNCSFMRSSEFAKNRRSNAKWDYGPNRAFYLEYYKSLTLPTED